MTVLRRSWRQLMFDCWSVTPAERPRFKEILGKLDEDVSVDPCWREAAPSSELDL
jgi:hypothetical protein